MLDAMDFRKICGKFATGITVVTGLLDDGTPVGVTVNSFSSVSLNPPLVLFSLDRQALSFDAFSMAKHFAFNILSESQADISTRFATPSVNKFSGIAYKISAQGVPILEGGLGTIECRMHAVHEGGDHQIIVGEVTKITHGRARKPLLYFSGGYASLVSPG